MQKDDLEKEFLRLNSRLARAYAQRLSEVVGVHDLSAGQYAIGDLIAQKGALTPSALAKLLDVETSTIAATLRRAEDAGIIRRSPDPHDGRGKVVELTELGAARVTQAQKAVDELSTDAIARLDGDDLSVAKRVVIKMIAFLGDGGK